MLKFLAIMSSKGGPDHNEDVEPTSQQHSTSMNESRASIHSKQNTQLFKSNKSNWC